MQDVRGFGTALRVEGSALPDAEAVLLVNDADAEPGELDGGLGESVGPDDEAELAGGQTAERIPPAGGR